MMTGANPTFMPEYITDQEMVWYLMVLSPIRMGVGLMSSPPRELGMGGLPFETCGETILVPTTLTTWQIWQRSSLNNYILHMARKVCRNRNATRGV